MLFAPTDDEHTHAVQRTLERRSVPTARIDLASVVHPVTIRPGRSVEVGNVVLEPGVAVWWRRTGIVPDLPGLDATENRLRAEESEALLIGGLLALTRRWVDDPFVVLAAEHTLKQLAAAARVGARVPDTIATNHPATARAALDRTAGGGRWLAKATSAGAGIAPYADVIDPATLDLLPACITLLQQVQNATADLRAVVVGDQVWWWIRPRSSDQPLDWRAADPTGRGFAALPDSLATIAPTGVAIEINRELGLRFSVQDWLVVNDEPVFLEVNPSGQWLFLTDAATTVSEALADLLCAGD
ncbi:hypothetical protein [Nocardioides kribbensis]|uniref:ATP-grasp domain-containing protein n=1 Tax=Nocardioides kribbensis TaxID=305517 RepID=A0ABV1P3G4_9ACTN